MGTALLPPGPRGHFLLGVLPEIRRDELDFLTHCVREYGDVCYVRVVNIPAYIVSNPEDIETVLIAKNSNFIKSVYLRESRALFGQGLLTSEGGFWLRQRRLLQPAFHHSRIAGYGTTMTGYAERMVATWRDGEVRDIHEDMGNLTMEIIAQVLFGDDLSTDTREAGDALRIFFDQFDDRFGLYVIPDWLPTPGNLRYRNAIRRLDQIIGRVIHERGAKSFDNGDILSSLLRVQDEDGSQMTETQVRDEVMTLFFTGHETTALALSWTWYLLAQHPEVVAKLSAELDAVLAGRVPAVEDLPKLIYTEWVVKESLRLYPPAYGIVREALTDVEIGGYAIPKGSTVAIFPWSVHRDPRYYEDPEAFRPERWDNNFQKTLPRCAYIPFGAGPRICIGNAFALTEVTLLLAAIARKFQVTLVPGHKVALSPSLTLRPRKGIKVTLKRR
ncbi:MAG: cytochrome P450 [Terriglobia bacterium]